MSGVEDGNAVGVVCRTVVTGAAVLVIVIVVVVVGTIVGTCVVTLVVGVVPLSVVVDSTGVVVVDAAGDWVG